MALFERGGSLASRTLSIAIAVFCITGCDGLISGCPEGVDPEQCVVWPISGTMTSRRLSSSFGPRIRIADDVYDFHRGIDIPVAEGTPVYAAVRGRVRLSGTTPYYEDPVVQIAHCADPVPPTDIDDCTELFYTNYQHLKYSTVPEGTYVLAGEMVGRSGVSAHDIPHLHFEIRYGSVYQRSAIHPLTWLPYEDGGPPEVIIDEVSFDDPTSPEVAVTVLRPPDDLDFTRVEVQLFAGANEVPMASQSYDVHEWNEAYTDDDDPNIYLDNPYFNDIIVDPVPFNGDSEEYEVHFRFRGLSSTVAAEEVRVEVQAVDVAGNVATQECHPCTP